MIVEDNPINNALIEQITAIVEEYDLIIMESYPNVVGVGVGQKYICERATGVPCLTIFVSKKVSECFLSSNEIIPKYFEGVMTDVYETGAICVGCPPPKQINCNCCFNNKCNCCNKTCRNSYPPIKKYNNCSEDGSNLGGYPSKYRPADGGVNLNPQGWSAFGTLGCAVATGKNIYILGNNHVFALVNKLPVGTPILQPAQSLGGTPPDKIATLSAFIPIKFITPTTKPVNRMDAAIALVGPISDQQMISKTLVAPGLHNGQKLTGVYTPRIGETVFKIGAASALTNGPVLTLSSSFSVTVADANRAYFKGQITTTKMAEGGDSGSIGFDGHNQAFGLLFFGSSKISAYNPMSEVLSAFSVNFWNL